MSGSPSAREPYEAPARAEPGDAARRSARWRERSRPGCPAPSARASAFTALPEPAAGVGGCRDHEAG